MHLRLKKLKIKIFTNVLRQNSPQRSYYHIPPNKQIQSLLLQKGGSKLCAPSDLDKVLPHTFHFTQPLFIFKLFLNSKKKAFRLHSVSRVPSSICLIFTSIHLYNSYHMHNSYHMRNSYHMHALPLHNMLCQRLFCPFKWLSNNL